MSTVDERLTPRTAPISGLPDLGQRVPVERRGEGARGLAWELIQTILLTIVIFFLVRSVVQNFRVEGASMEPTLHTGQYLLINKAAYFHVEGTPLESIFPPKEGGIQFLFGGPQRGEVAVFRAPTQPDKDFIKRVIGLPGDTVLIRQGQVLVNGQRLDEPYIEFPANYSFPPSGQAVRVPDGQYFVLGDNRPNSSDSHLGWFVPLENLVGRAWVSYWPPSTWGIVGDTALAR